MGAKTDIAWSDSTWTPVRARVRQDAKEIAAAKGYTSLVKILEARKPNGELRTPPGKIGPHCEKVSPECENCYSETNGERCLPANGTGLPFDRRARDLVEMFVDTKILEQPLRWRTPRKIFVCSQTDLFGEFVTDEMIDRVFAIMALCPQHTFQVLTKRAKRMREYFKDLTYRQEVIGIRAEYLSGIDRFISGREVEGITACADDILPRWALPLANAWLGVSAGDQQRADERIPELLATPAAVRFLSVEPLLGPVNLASVEVDICIQANVLIRWCDHPFGSMLTPDARIDLVIVGGESGPGARPMHPGWAQSIRDQCVVAGVPFFFKQWGAWLGADQDGANIDGHQILNASNKPTRIGARAAGCLLDGREWKQMPEVAHG